ncbi:MAG TPA: aldo/keto reductase, partial [Myxococcaceae bacterium]|nr:aldo/keto reductase [Myxococcaceae bacterium]
IDTARSYGLSEERIGRHLSWRRHKFVLSTKGGYGIDGVADWTGACVTEGIEAALKRLATDYIDIYHLHSCPADVLERGDIQEALEQAVWQGKVRVAAYSGDNEPLERAIVAGPFRSVQTSVNLFDQRVLGRGLAQAREKGLGVIAKRPLGNAPWRFSERPQAHDIGQYWDRMRALDLHPHDVPWEEYALRFAAFQPGVSSCIVGTSKLEHLLGHLRAVEKGPLPENELRRIREAFSQHGKGWEGVI